MKAAELTLEQIKARMTDEQRRDMAEIIQNEVKRREGMKQQRSYGARPLEKSDVRGAKFGRSLNAEGMGEVYSEIQDKVKNLRMQQIDQKLAEARKLGRQVPRAAGGGIKWSVLTNKNTLLVGGIVLLAFLKIVTASHTMTPSQTKPAAAPAATDAVPVDETAQSTDQTQSTPAAAAPQTAAPVANAKPGNWTVAEKQVLSELDARRVDLERRRQILDQREEDLKQQSQTLSERLAELKTLSGHMSQVRKERDNQYEARLEQLANVYGSMAPAEAAPLVNKLDEETALALLKRMPGKRMGQILSLMEPERAVQLTRVLSDKTKLDELPIK